MRRRRGARGRGRRKRGSSTFFDPELESMTSRISRCQSDPDLVRCLFLRAILFYDRLDAPAALEDLNKIEKLSPTAESSYHLGRVYTRFGLDYDLALTFFLAAESRIADATTEPSQTIPEVLFEPYELHYWFGRTYECLFRYVESLTHFKACVELRPDFLRGKFELGRYYFAHEVNWRQSLNYLNEVLDADGDHFLALCEKARVWNNMGKGDESIALLQRAIHISNAKRERDKLPIRRPNPCLCRGEERSDWAYPYIVLSKTFKDRGHVAKAIEALSQAAECPMSEYYSRNCLLARLGFMKMSSGDFTGAEADFEKAMRNLNEKDYAHSQLTHYYRILYDFSTQHEVLRGQEGLLEGRFQDECIRSNPNNPYIYLYIGNFYKNKINDLRRAIQYYELAVQKNPRCSLGYYNMAETYESLRKSQEAIVAATKAASINSEDHYSLELAGDQYGIQKNYAAALEMYGAAIRYNHPRRIVYRVSRAQAYICVGRIDDALEDLRIGYGRNKPDENQMDRSDALLAEIERCSSYCRDSRMEEEIERRTFLMRSCEELVGEEEEQGEQEDQKEEEIISLQRIKFVVPTGSTSTVHCVPSVLLCSGCRFFQQYKEFFQGYRELVITVEDESFSDAMGYFVRWVYGMSVDAVVHLPKTFVRLSVLGEFFQLPELVDYLASRIQRMPKSGVRGPTPSGYPGGAPSGAPGGIDGGIFVEDQRVALEIMLETCSCSSSLRRLDSLVSVKTVPPSSSLPPPRKSVFPPLMRLLMKCVEYHREVPDFLKSEMQGTSDDERQECLEQIFRLVESFNIAERRRDRTGSSANPHPCLVRKAPLPLLGGENRCFRMRLREVHSNGMDLANLTLVSEDGHSYPCHREVLIMRSRYFKTMLTSSFRESRQKAIQMEKISGAVLRVLIRHLYCHKVKGPVESKLLHEDVATAANMLCLRSLERQCRLHETHVRLREARRVLDEKRRARSAQ